MDRFCEYCKKILTTNQRHNRFCSNECANEFKKEQRIIEWKNGDFNGLRKNGQLSSAIRNYLLKKVNYKCEICGWGEVNPITNCVPLEVHHIDGNYLNNSPSNLQVLCPNCHSLTENYKSLNTSNRIRTQSRKNFCIDCGQVISSGSLRCRKCEGKQRVTEKPVSRDELKKLIRTIPFTQISLIYNVSDNAVRKWCIKYNLPSKKKDIKAYTDEEWELL